jgi:hypothetical protein
MEWAVGDEWEQASPLDGRSLHGLASNTDTTWDNAVISEYSMPDDQDDNHEKLCELLGKQPSKVILGAFLNEDSSVSVSDLWKLCSQKLLPQAEIKVHIDAVISQTLEITIKVHLDYLQKFENQSFLFL